MTYNHADALKMLKYFDPNHAHTVKYVREKLLPRFKAALAQMKETDDDWVKEGRTPSPRIAKIAESVARCEQRLAGIKAK